jgi:hypothetical protein
MRGKRGKRSKLLFVTSDLAAIITFGPSQDGAASCEHFDTVSILDTFSAWLGVNKSRGISRLVVL